MVYVYSESRRWWVPGKGWMTTADALQTGERKFEEFRPFKSENDANAHAKNDPDLKVTVAKRRLTGR